MESAYRYCKENLQTDLDARDTVAAELAQMAAVRVKRPVWVLGV